jgi:Zn-dependent M28 family amino/carboxypeptidase
MKRQRWAWFLAVVAVVLILTVSAQVPRKGSVIDSAQLLSDLKVLSSDGMEGRLTGTPGGDKARAFVVTRFKASGLAAFGSSYEQEFTFGGRGTSSNRRGVNVVGKIEGSRVPGRYIVVSAHYDHIGTRNGQVFNGADDNASGTAALFALAKYFAAHRPTNSLIFAAFDAEELGQHGSRTFVNRPPVDKGLLALNVNIDMIGREPADRLFVVGTALRPFLRPHVDAIAAKAPVKLLVGHEDPRQPEDWTQDSDHYSFIQAGIPALYFGVEDFEHHHQATDDYETMSYDFYVRAVETLVQAIERFDANLDSIAAAGRVSR